jgi:hypothetical protein
MNLKQICFANPSDSMKLFSKSVRVATATVLFTILASTLFAAEVRFNEIQVIGTHNSYHIMPHESMLKLIATKMPEAAKALEYTHRPLPEQFSQLGIRQIELDIAADPQGGLYAEPKGIKIATERGMPTGSNHDPNGLLRKAGMKVLHVEDFDFRSTVLTFVEGLKQVRQWSKAHPGHVPIFILVELKEDSIGPEFTQPVPFGPHELDAIDAEILSVFKPEEILKPDDVRGSFTTLPEALLKNGWPTLDSVRGKVLFAMDNGGSVRDLYLKEHPALKGRLLFVNVEDDNPAAAWMKMNDPIADFEKIQKLVKAGFLVRTRADTDTQQARADDPTQRDKALASGAQFISTDYPEPNPAFSSYRVSFEHGLAVRSNPLIGNPSLKGKELENHLAAKPKN